MKIRKIIYYLILITILVICPQKAYAHPTIDNIFNTKWQSTTENITEAYTSNVKEVEDGYIIVGKGEKNDYSYCVIVQKIDKTGKVLWKNEYDTTSWFPSFGIAIDDNNNIYVSNEGTGLRKYNQEGKELAIYENLKGYNLYYSNNQFFLILSNSDILVLDKNLNVKETLTIDSIWGDINSAQFNDKIYGISSGENDSYQLLIIDSATNKVETHTINGDLNYYGIEATLYKDNDTYYFATMNGIFKIDNNYNASLVLPSTNENYIENNIKYKLDFTSITKWENYFLVTGLKSLDKENCLYTEIDSRQICNEYFRAIVRIYDKDFNLVSEINLNELYGFEDSYNYNLSVGKKIIFTEDGFLVGGLISSINEETQTNYGFISKFSVYYKVDTKVLEGKGTLKASKKFSNGKEQITYTVEPEPGYSLISLRVVTKSGVEVKVDGNSFIMPEEDVVIEARFASIINPSTISPMILVVAIVSLTILTTLIIQKKAHNNEN